MAACYSTAPVMHHRPMTRTSPQLDAAIDAALTDHLADGGIPGVAAAVGDDRGTIAIRQAGLAEVAGGVPVTETTLFEVGSIGKSFTAAVILQLADEGRLALDDPVVRHLPWFRVPRTAERITIHHLLSHTAGITAGVDGTPEATVQVSRLRDLRPGAAPGRRCHYSNVGYKALGLVIEALEERAYRSVIADRIIGPLGLAAGMEPAITDAIRPRMAVGYQAADPSRPWRAGDPIAPSPWLTTGTADGSVASTAGALLGFARWLMGDPGGITSRMGRPVPAIGAFGYGYGLMRREVAGRTYLGHGGGMVGYLASMLWDADARIAAVVLQNGMDGNPNALARRLIRQARAAEEGRDPSTEGPETVPAGEDEPLPPVVDAVDAWRTLAGTYLSHQPWTPRFTVDARSDGRLWLSFPGGAPDGFDEDQPLVPMAGGWFRVGEDRLGPERLRFDTVVDGLTRRAWLSGWDFYREDR
jgi:CubicO group peptidase (beta-lactamase class C family)